MRSKKLSSFYPFYHWLKTMFPWHRSLSGKGNIKTLSYLKSINNNLKIYYFKSGQKCFDWVIPKQWEIKKAYIKHEKGKVYCDIRKNNLHIVQYSKPIHTTLDKKELQKKLFTLRDKPKSIPYVTSYYKEDWGFCIKYDDYKKMPKGKYEVRVDSSLKKGKIPYGEISIKGQSKKEIFFSTYICHPSMANNELSGPTLSIGISKYILENYKNNKFSYRFIFIPETIDQLLAINKNLKKLKKMLFVYNLSCVGDDRRYSIIKSRLGNTLADISLIAALKIKKLEIYNFLERGQTKDNASGYHYVDFQNLSIILIKNIIQVMIIKLFHRKVLRFSLFKDIIDTFENSFYPKANIYVNQKWIKEIT